MRPGGHASTEEDGPPCPQTFVSVSCQSVSYLPTLGRLRGHASEVLLVLSCQISIQQILTVLASLLRISCMRRVVSAVTRVEVRRVDV